MQNLSQQSFIIGYINAEDGSVSGLPLGVALETPLHPKRPPRVRVKQPSCPPKTSPLKKSRRNSSVPCSSVKLNSSPMSLPVPNEHPVPLPAAFVTCGGGGDQGSPRKKRKPIGRQQRPKQEEEISAIHYGSEDESGGDYADDEEGFCVAAFVPRAARMFFEDEDFEYEDFNEENIKEEYFVEYFEEVSSVGQTLQSKGTERAPSPSPSPLTSSTPMGPTDLFHFDWSNFPALPVDPTERREVFSENNCGPTVPLLTPYDAFIAIWSRDFLEYIATETNRYAQEFVEKQFQAGSLAPTSRIAHWYDTNADELYVFFALILATGMCVKSDLSEYWSKDDIMQTPLFPQYMSYGRFFLLTRCLHFNQNSSDIKRLSRSHAKLHKISPVLDHLNSRFQSLYRLGRNIALDESLTQWKGSLEFKQFIKNKVASAGIKTYEVCEAQTGYLWRFKVYAGREVMTEQDGTSAIGVIPTLVLELLNGLEHKGHTVWMDNYYNSPALARVLKTLGFDCVGTLRTNRKYVPRELAALTKSEMVFGEITGCTSGDVDILVWRDQNRVALISTYHGAAVQSIQGKIKPIAIHDYNVCMGGVDKKDQMLSTYPIERKRSQVWYKKLFRRLLNVSVLNAFILHRSSVSPDGQTTIKDHREFRKTLIRELLVKHKVRPGIVLKGVTKTWNGPKHQVTNVVVLPQEVLRHFPAEYGFIPGRNKERRRHACVVCHKRVSTFCPACKVALCLGCTITFHK